MTGLRDPRNELSFRWANLIDIPKTFRGSYRDFPLMMTSLARLTSWFAVTRRARRFELRAELGRDPAKLEEKRADSRIGFAGRRPGELQQGEEFFRSGCPRKRFLLLLVKAQAGIIELATVVTRQTRELQDRHTTIIAQHHEASPPSGA